MDDPTVYLRPLRRLDRVAATKTFLAEIAANDPGRASVGTSGGGTKYPDEVEH